MATVLVYRHYRFIDKDPVIDKLRTMVEDEGIKQQHVATMAGVSPTTLYNWFEGGTRKPQFATIAAVAATLGYDFEFKKQKNVKIDVERELETAAREIAERKKNPKAQPKVAKPYKFR